MYSMILNMWTQVYKDKGEDSIPKCEQGLPPGRGEVLDDLKKKN